MLGYSILTVSRQRLGDLLSLGEAGEVEWRSLVGRGLWHGVLSARTRDGRTLHGRGAATAVRVAGECLYVFYLTLSTP